jgi:hypothetical protein
VQGERCAEQYIWIGDMKNCRFSFGEKIEGRKTPLVGLSSRNGVTKMQREEVQRKSVNSIQLAHGSYR